MKKVLVLLLLIVSTSVFAEWTPVDGSKDGDMTFYVDYGSIKKKGHKVKIWCLFDSKTVQKYSDGIGYLSSLSHQEFDCEEETTRLLDWYWYSGNMAQGGIVFSDTNIKNDEKSIVPRSIEETYLKKVCGKK